MQFLEKLWKMWENIEMLLILSQNKEEETVWCQNQIIILQSFSQKMPCYRNEKNTDTYEEICLFRPYNTIIK